MQRLSLSGQYYASLKFLQFPKVLPLTYPLCRWKLGIVVRNLSLVRTQLSPYCTDQHLLGLGSTQIINEYEELKCAMKIINCLYSYEW